MGTPHTVHSQWLLQAGGWLAVGCSLAMMIGSITGTGRDGKALEGETEG